MDIFHIILIILVAILGFIAFRSEKKLRVYENIVNKYDTMVERISTYMKNALNKLISLDRQQVFEADDDVGYFFKSLKEEIVNLNNNIASITNENPDETEESA